MDAFGPLNRLSQTLREHDERGLVLCLAAFAEEALGRLLTAFLLPVTTTEDLLTGFNAPLGTFSARIKACYSLGLINQEQFKDLEYLRKIRNEFAHSWESTSLAQDKLASFSRNMSFSFLEKAYPETNAEKIRGSIAALLADITSMAQQIEDKHRGIKVTGTRLFPMFQGDFVSQIAQAAQCFADLQINIESASGELRRFYNRRRELLQMQLQFLILQVPTELKSHVEEILVGLKNLPPNDLK